jgi:hypothetical protein
MKLKDEWFKHFRIFLKKNYLYKDFMECFQRQQFRPKHKGLEHNLRPNYIKIMKEYCIKDQSHEEFGAMSLTFDSFTWVETFADIPRDFTVRWCTVSYRWGLYCIDHNIPICSMERFVELINYWNSNNWINPHSVSKKERKIYDRVESMVKEERLKRLNSLH